MAKRPRMRKQPLTFENLNMLEGRYFSSGQLFQGVSASGGTAVIILENPSSSPKRFFVAPQTVRTEGKAYVRKYFNVDYSGGSAPDTAIINKNSGNDREKNANVVVNPSSFSGGTQFSPKLIGSEAGAIRAGGSSDDVANVVNPGDNVLIEVENVSANPEDISIDIDWLEV